MVEEAVLILDHGLRNGHRPARPDVLVVFLEDFDVGEDRRQRLQQPLLADGVILEEGHEAQQRPTTNWLVSHTTDEFEFAAEPLQCNRQQPHAQGKYV